MNPRPDVPQEAPIAPEVEGDVDLEQAHAFLTQLGAALFGDGMPGPEQLTWSDPVRPEAAEEMESERNRLERQLLHAQQRFQTLIEQIPAVTFMAVLGEGLNEIYVSPHIERMLGYTQQEWLADPFLWYYRLHPDDRKLWNDEFARGCRTGGPFRAECRFLARNGDVVWVLGEARLVKDALGRPQFLQGVAFDITESKRAQQLVLAHAVEAAQIEQDLRIARRIQTSILPADPSLPGLEMAAGMQAAEQVGGDYYDVRPTADGGGWIAIGDVSGHGVNAGLVMLMVQSALAALTLALHDSASPAQIVTRLNEVMFQNVRQRMAQQDYVTLCVLRYFRDGRVSFAGAHQHVLICRWQSGAVERVLTQGTWIGLRADIGATTLDQQLQLHDRDLLVLYTDGLIEARDANDEAYDLPRLCAAIERLRAQPLADIRDRILADTNAWCARRDDDDVTLMVLRYTAAEEGRS